MRRFVVPLVALVGACLVLTGVWWMWTGYDIVQIERGWSSLIAGATMLSAGFVMLALAAVIGKLEEIAAAMRVASPQRPLENLTAVEASPKPPAPVAETEQDADPIEPENLAPSHKREIVGTHRSGDATYTMFSDGSVEAETSEGTLNFASLDELRAYADERALADAR